MGRSESLFRWALLLACLPAAACDDSGGGAGDGAPSSDAAPAPDFTIEVDADLPDATGAPEVDATLPDASTMPDGGTPDAAAPGCALPRPFDEGAVYAREVRLAPGESLVQAAADAMPGTRIILEPGVHGRALLRDLRGTADAPIAIVGEPGAVIDADGGNDALHLVEPAYVVLQDLELRGGVGNGLNIDDGGTFDTPAHHVVLRRLRVHDVGVGDNNDCIKLSGLEDFAIVDSEVTDCRVGSAIDMVGCHDGLIANNDLHDKRGNSVIQAKGGTRDILIHGNRFTDTDGRGVNAGGSTGLQFFRPQDAPHEAANIVVVANVFVRVGAESGAPIAYVGCDACVFVHNTVVEPRTWVARILQERTEERFVTCRDGLFLDNIVAYRAADLRTTVNVGPDTAPETFDFGHNLWHALDDPNAPVPAHPGGVPPEHDSVTGDPRFIDDDYRLADDSAALGVARPGPLPWPDHDGRCFGPNPPAGAFAARN